MITWLPWSAGAFARAARESKPVLLSITAAWCQACHEMDRTTYADPDVAALVRDSFVAVRVDTDRRPDINERYNLGGWPTTAFLTSGGDVITGSTFLSADKMTAVLKRVANALPVFASMSRPTRDANGLAVAEGVAGEGGGIETIIESVFATFDDEYAGFGVEPKFPHTAPLHLALALFRETGHDRWRTIVERTLDAMAAGGLWDAKGGGFYRYATGPDWESPSTEKLLETNAELLRIYAEAALVLERPVDRDRLAPIAGFITGTLRAEAGGYRGSHADGTPYMDGNAKAAGALLGAAAVLDDSALGRDALASFERVILRCYKPGAGLAHYSDGVARVRGLLGDQIHTAGALLDAHDVSGLEPYTMMAEELTRVAIRDLWDEAGGGFFDRAGHDGDIGLLRARRKPFILNAEAATVLARLERTCGDPEFLERGKGALAAAAEQLDGQGPLAAHYVLGARQLSRPVIS